MIPKQLKVIMFTILIDNFEVETNTHNVVKAVHEKWNVVSAFTKTLFDDTLVPINLLFKAKYHVTS